MAPPFKLPRQHVPQQGIPPTGTYWIQTSDGQVYVALTDGNTGTPFTTVKDEDDKNIRFNVTKLTDNNTGDYPDPPEDEEYNIASFQYANYAILSQENAAVEGKADPVRWVIRELDVKGHYWICSLQTTNPRVYWTLDDHNPGSTVKLTSDISKAQSWKLTREFH